MFYLLSSIFLLVYIFFDNSLGFSETSAWWTHIAYNFQHAGIIHLLLNAFCFSQFYKVFKKIKKGNRHSITPNKAVAIGGIVAVSCSFLPFCIKPLPTVGASGIIYAMLGIYLSLLVGAYPCGRPAVKVPKKNLIIWLSGVAIALVVSFFNPHSAFALHLSCLIIGFLLSLRSHLTVNSILNS